MNVVTTYSVCICHVVRWWHNNKIIKALELNPPSPQLYWLCIFRYTNIN